MDESERRHNEVLIEGLGNTAFFEALVKRIGDVRAVSENKLHAVPKTDQLNEHIMALMIANGACVALDSLESDITALREEAMAKHL
jgi:hypothetical protein